MGTLSAQVIRNRETYRFTYDEAWLASPHTRQLDPRLHLVSGPQYPPPAHLWIAKFPSGDDDEDVGAWEMVLHELAERAGISVAPARCERFGSAHHTFLTRRFDRRDGARLHMASAMTHLEMADGETEGASYLQLAEVLIQQGAAPARDLDQLWRRIVFFVCTSNVDDHLRNHAFMLEPTGWRLAPAYDMNPVPWGDGLSLNISDVDNAQDLDLIREVAPYFRVDERRADRIIAEVIDVVREWRSTAARRDDDERRAAAAIQLMGFYGWLEMLGLLDPDAMKQQVQAIAGAAPGDPAILDYGESSRPGSSPSELLTGRRRTGPASVLC